METLIAQYKKHLNLHTAIFTRIEHDDAIVAIVYQVTLTNGAQMILKICTRPEEFARESYFLAFFADKLPVPRIIGRVLPEATLPGAILMEYLPGKPLRITDITNALAYEMGSLMARIHLNQATAYGDPTNQSSLTNDPRIYFGAKFKRDFPEYSNHLPAKLLDQCLDYFTTHIDALKAVDGPCMIHRDFRPGNMMVLDGTLQGIIDWAAGRSSFAEEDFYPMEHWEWPNNSASKSSFLAGYASIRPVPDYTQTMPLIRLSRALDTMGFTLKRGTWNGKDARVYQFNRHFVESFFAKN